MLMKVTKRWAATVVVLADALTDAILDAKPLAMVTVMVVAEARVAEVAMVTALVVAQTPALIVVLSIWLF